MNIQLPSDIKVINPNPEGEGVQLPFIAPLFWWKNGDKRMSQIGGVQYFGGWESNEEDITAAVAENGQLPDDFVPDSRMGNDGAYQVYSRRSLTVAPIKTRRRWVDGRSHSQTLVLLGVKREGGGFDAWGCAVLTAKGYATDRLSKAITAWNTHTSAVRKEIAPGVPSWYFWQAIGTFGDFKEESVGSKVKNAITPIEAYLPTMTADLLKSLYVGDDAARLISELSEKAQEWATDKRWLKNEKEEEDAETEYSPVQLEEQDFPF